MLKMDLLPVCVDTERLPSVQRRGTRLISAFEVLYNSDPCSCQVLPGSLDYVS